MDASSKLCVNTPIVASSGEVHVKPTGNQAPSALANQAADPHGPLKSASLTSRLKTFCEKNAHTGRLSKLAVRFANSAIETKSKALKAVFIALAFSFGVAADAANRFIFKQTPTLGASAKDTIKQVQVLQETTTEIRAQCAAIHTDELVSCTQEAEQLTEEVQAGNASIDEQVEKLGEKADEVAQALNEVVQKLEQKPTPPAIPPTQHARELWQAAAALCEAVLHKSEKY